MAFLKMLKKALYKEKWHAHKEKCPAYKK